MSVVRPLGPSSENTRSAILDLVRSSGTVSRIELAEMSGLTATSITRFVKTLIDAGLIIETGYGDSSGGKRPSLLELNRGARYAVGLSLDDARLSYVVTDLGGSVVGRLVSRGIAGAAPSDVIARIAVEVGQVLSELSIPLDKVVGIGVAGAGLDIRGGGEGLSVTAAEWESFAVAQALEAQTGLLVVRDNDAACAALGEFWVGRIPATQDFASLYMSNGFGLGLMMGGALVRGSSSNVGEIGHMPLSLDGPDCWCGARGCLEMLAAPRAIVARALVDSELTADLGLTQVGGDSRQAFERIARAAAGGEPRSVALIEQAARAVATAVLAVVNVLDLDRLYLSGPGFAEIGEIYAREIRSTLTRCARTRAVHGVRVELSDPGLDAAAIGAASLALQHVLTPHVNAGRDALAPAGAR
ncbi:ROK family transcriptional regulator [Mycetocola tolaasinivorans]|uniref:ROK family transcriptional regulator n=1 Tax=Mycetocola tolaasinivorans TaxID=76635 RepID=A0A3L7A8Z9_9MICO|nr:ROK family transcriptional regulator [Mycetocola tolaasinivorans]RLP76809.1 ROK family transcriptional regulator [Mycetocola tolaasinivorans]